MLFFFGWISCWWSFTFCGLECFFLSSSVPLCSVYWIQKSFAAENAQCIRKVFPGKTNKPAALDQPSRGISHFTSFSKVPLSLFELCILGHLCDTAVHRGQSQFTSVLPGKHILPMMSVCQLVWHRLSKLSTYLNPCDAFHMNTNWINMHPALWSRQWGRDINQLGWTESFLTSLWTIDCTHHVQHANNKKVKVYCSRCVWGVEVRSRLWSITTGQTNIQVH